MNAKQLTFALVSATAICGLAALLLTSGCAPSSAPAAVQTSTPASNPAAAKQPPKDISFDTIKLAKMKDKNQPFTRELLTPQIERLDGQRVRLRGFILPPPQQTGLTRFMLVRDNMACCFGPGSWLYDRVKVDLVPGVSTDYKLSPIVVEGIFNIHEIQMPDGSYMAIYRVTADKVQ